MNKLNCSFLTWFLRGDERDSSGLEVLDGKRVIGIRFSGAQEQPNCRTVVGVIMVSHEWPEFPAGVKFDPSDLELLKNLAAKYGVGNYDLHMFIGEFIPAVEEEGGLCSAHPQYLLGNCCCGDLVLVRFHV